MIQKAIKRLKTIKDERGSLVELFVEELPKGQVYTFTIKPNKIRGKHYHKRKNEMFVIIDGKVKVSLVGKTTKKKKAVICDSSKGVMKVFVGKNMVHSFENIGKKDARVIAFISEKYNEKDPDTYFD